MDDGVAASNRAFRDYTVLAKVSESQVITSLVLAPASAGEVPAYRPGQHLIFRLNVAGEKILRHYSISGDPAGHGTLRVSVKREPPPRAQPGLPPGAGSGHMHDHVQVGDTLTAAGPVGDFTLAEDSERPVLLLSGGVGLTPMMCMLHRLVQSSNRPVYFVHACENGDVHAFADEVTALARQRPGVCVHFCYREPTVLDQEQHRFHSTGLIRREILQALLPLDDYEVYLCGPPAFMQANWRLLRGLGVTADRIHYEFFGPATVLETDQDMSDSVPLAGKAGIEGAAAPLVAAADHEIATDASLGPKVSASVESGGNESGAIQVKFGPSGITVPWDPHCPSLLDLAEQAGLSPNYNCRAGLCNTCMSTLVTGDVDYFEPPLDPPPEGKVLLCCSRPVGSVVIELAS
ncbi:MAG: 2Fe-2S iron-sulfur cluster binding domain-containing protein [Candidimonas sp.]|nr:MAG: 2Fe-2S iron-sulfur cluster binding domain-containing protein [Candidimonas sp.]TAM23043.1 MAG: 2Fe-2S iron-sulfur cluster binding domain-containing protein [Candidimonas sp.]TAM80850.1 MAG: 2Fe-2S iron-sulfur cluster binding domain-containing protein [Candidimonas sp.]